MSVGSTGFGGPTGGGSRGGGALLLFSAAHRSDPRGSTVSYAANGGFAGAPESMAPQRYPSGRRAFQIVRVTVLEMDQGVPLVITLCKKKEPTPLLVVVPVGAREGDHFTGRHVVNFTDDDDFDVRTFADTDANPGRAKVAISVE